MLNIGVVGCGAIGREHIERLNNKIQGCRVTAVTDVFEESAKKAGEPIGATIHKDSKALINDQNVDAVVVTTPGFAHKEAVMQAIEAGKPVFCEKPLATTAQDCLDIVEAEMATGKHLVQVGFMRRYDKGYRQVKKLVDEKAYGEPLVLHCTHRAPSVGPDYDTPQAVTETMIHEIDVLHWLINDEYESAQVVIPKSTKNTTPILKDPQIMMLKTKSGIFIEVEVFVHCRFGYDIECVVVCEEGSIKMPEPSFPTVRYQGARHTPIEMDWKTRFIDAYDTELKEWVESTVKGEVNGPTAWDGYLASVTADALVKAQTSGAIEPIVTTKDTPDFYK